MRSVNWILILLVAGLALFLVHEKWWPQGRGTLVVLSEPAGAEIWIDLKATGLNTNGAISNLQTGSHSVLVKKDGLVPEPVAQAVEIRPNQIDTLRFRLLPAGQTRQQTAAPKLSDQPVPKPQTSPEPAPVIATADELRRQAAQRDTLSRTAQPGPPAAKDTSGSPSPLVMLPIPDTVPVSPAPETGLIEVSSSASGARIYIDNVLQADVTPATITLPLGVYVVKVERAGYHVSPSELTIRLGRSAVPQKAFFSLKEEVAPELHIRTEPVEGMIYVDSLRAGEGEARVRRPFGVYMVHFGDVQGWKPPPPQRVSITPAQRQPEVVATYTPAFRVMARVDGENVVTTEGGIAWSVGYYVEGEGMYPSPTFGAKLREIPASQKFGWELAAGDPNRNPTGGDYVEFTFELPEDVPPTTSLGLRLYFYRSTRRYTFAISGRSEIVVGINNRTFLDNYRPANGTEAADLEKFEEWSLQGMLIPGKNRIVVRAGDRNLMFNYLWKIEVL